MKVTFGSVDGKHWEEYCHKVLRIKFESEDYIHVPSKFGGDLGIESFTKTGRAFQCYCPDGDLSSTELYKKQRKKITDDLRALVKNEHQLTALLGLTKINKWYLVTPRYDNKELIAHCEKKAREVRARSLSHLSDDFSVLIMTEQDFILEQQKLISAGIQQVTVDLPTIAPDMIEEWTQSKNELYDNIRDKLSKIPNVPNMDTLVGINIQRYLAGQYMLDKLQKDHPPLYEQLVSIKTSQEEKVQLFSLIPTGPPGEFLKKCFEDYEALIKENLGRSISAATITHLTGEAVSDWLARCPLDF